MLSCVSCLYILEISPLSVASIANSFSHSVSSFVLFMVSFAVQKLLSLIRSHLFIFVLFFFPLNLEGGSKKILLRFMSVFCLCFLIKNFPSLLSPPTLMSLLSFSFLFSLKYNLYITVFQVYDIMTWHWYSFY